jgi:hypothetical protein
MQAGACMGESAWLRAAELIGTAFDECRVYFEIANQVHHCVAAGDDAGIDYWRVVAGFVGCMSEATIH